jgi:hypothetical protein
MLGQIVPSRKRRTAAIETDSESCAHCFRCHPENEKLRLRRQADLSAARLHRHIFKPNDLSEVRRCGLNRSGAGAALPCGRRRCIAAPEPPWSALQSKGHLSPWRAPCKCKHGGRSSAEHTGIYGPLSQSDECVPDEMWPAKPCLADL